jgi:hypothetical protein
VKVAEPTARIITGKKNDWRGAEDEDEEDDEPEDDSARRADDCGV